MVYSSHNSLSAINWGCFVTAVAGPCRYLSIHHPPISANVWVLSLPMTITMAEEGIKIKTERIRITQKTAGQGGGFYWACAVYYLFLEHHLGLCGWEPWGMRYLLKVASWDLIHVGWGSGLVTDLPGGVGEGAELWSEARGFTLTTYFVEELDWTQSPFPEFRSFFWWLRKGAEGRLGCV